jgi:GT2 family glycosyltransferase
MKNPICVVIPNWDGADMIESTLDSLKKQTLPCDIIVVDNGSKDASLDILHPLAESGEIILIAHPKNLGFAGGMNAGFRYAIDHGYEAVAGLNNDAVADKNWLKYMFECLQSSPKIGTVTCKILSRDGKTMDSTGDWYSVWGLPYPRGRDEPTSNKYDHQTDILGASGGASLFRCTTLQEIGLYDQDFFAYYEDIDLSLRTRLAGWQIRLEPRAFVLHATSSTSNRVHGFTTKQTMKNLPWILFKDIPASLFWRMYPRFLLAYTMFFGKAIVDGRGWWALRGLAISIVKTPKKLWQRRRIQQRRKITPTALNKLLLHDLPPNARNLRRLRAGWWRLTGKKS